MPDRAAPRRPVRIGNSSGFYGDRMEATREMVEGGPIDVLTGDYLAELTMLILWKARQKDPGAGYARSVLAQLEPVLGTCLDRGIKIVNNAGGLNPAGLAAQLAALASRLGLHPKIAYVTGDDLDAPLQAGAEHLLHLPQERGRVTQAGVLLPRLPQDQHGQLGQVVTGDDVDGAAVDDLAHRREPVAVEAGGVRDPHRRPHRTAPGARPVPASPANA